MLYKTLCFLFEAIAVKQYLIFSGCFFFLCALVMLILDAQLIPVHCPGILSLELAFFRQRVAEIISACGPDGTKAHAVMIWVDYLFILGYAGFLSNLLGALARDVKSIDYRRAVTYFSLPLFAGLLDIIENTILLYQIQNPDSLNSQLIFLASLSALVKFILIALSIILIIKFIYMKLNPAGKTA